MQRMDRRVRACCAGAAMAALVLLAMPAHGQWTWTPQTGRWINIKNLPKETAELQIEFARTFLIEGDHKRAFKETNKFANFYPDSDLADQNQFLRGEIRMAQDKLVGAANEFQLVVTMYPDSSLYDDVIAKQYEIGDILYEKGQARLRKKWRLFRKRGFKQAIEVYSMVIDNQPFTDAAAEAQYKVGLCHHTREEYIEAAYEYKRVIEDYSTSEWVDDASHGLAVCYCDSARPPDYDQEPSQLAVNAIDDFTERFPDDERVADLEAKRAGMRESIAQQRLQTAQFYEKRRSFDSARTYYEVLVEKFDETAAADAARQWLEDNPVMEVRAADRVLHGKRAAS